MAVIGLCLPMDRANALFNMTLPGQSQPGMYWVSEIHVAVDPERAKRMKGYSERPAMNKRFLWLMEEEALSRLGLREDIFMKEWTTPKEALPAGRSDPREKPE